MLVKNNVGQKTTNPWREGGHTDNDAIKTNFGHKIHISRHTKQNVGAAPYHKIYVDKATGPEPKHNVIITS